MRLEDSDTVIPQYLWGLVQEPQWIPKSAELKFLIQKGAVQSILSILGTTSMDPTHRIRDCLNPRMRNLWIQTAYSIQQCTKCGWRHSNGEDRVPPSETSILVVIYLRKRKKNKTISASVKCYEWNETGPYGRETGGQGRERPLRRCCLC